MATGLVVDAAGFEVLAGEDRVGSRRLIGPDDVEFLTGLSARYVRAVQAGSDAGVFVGLGRELYRWLDGDQGQLAGLLERAGPGRWCSRWPGRGRRRRRRGRCCGPRSSCWPHRTAAY